MAADGAWKDVETPCAADERERATLAALRDVLAQAEARLARPDLFPIPPAAMGELVRGLEALNRRIARAEGISSDRLSDLRASLLLVADRMEAQSAETAALAERLAASEARLDQVLVAVAPWPKLVRGLLWSASVLAAMSVTAAAALVGSDPKVLPPGLEAAAAVYLGDAAATARP